MVFNSKTHHRKSIRLKEYDYTNPNGTTLLSALTDCNTYLEMLRT